MPIASTDEQLALQASIREWAKRAAVIDVVRGLEPGTGSHHGIATALGDGPAAERWASLAELGVFGIGLPAAAGGAGGSTADLAAALSQLTESLVPGPVLPTQIAALVLRSCLDQRWAQAALRSLAAGEISVAVALDGGSVAAARRPDGSVALTGRVGPMLGGGSTTHLLVAASAGATGDSTRDKNACEAADNGPVYVREIAGRADDFIWCLLAADQPGIKLTELAPADFSRPLADVALADVAAGADQVLNGISIGRVRDLAAALSAVEAAAVASWCTRTAAEYAVVRHQFGRPIGTFQAVKHLCAGMLCRAEAAAALASDAARAIDDAPAQLPLIAAAAAAVSLDAAVEVAKGCIQVLGGIGFTWEHDAHLYLRRALALRQLLGGSAHWRDRAALLALSGIRRQLQLDETEVTAELAVIRQDARQLAATIAGLPGAQQRRALADSGYAAPAWPPPYGLAASPAALLVIDDELGKAGVSRPDLVIGGWAIPAILSAGSKAQADRFAGPTLRGELSWCQLFSEPEAGSDLASLRTTAERVDDGWLLTGQKVWTSLAREAHWAICLARTDTAAPKHKGLTYFLVAMDSAGIEIRPLREMTGRQMFNQVFLDRVFVPDECVVGAPGEGWRVARTTLASERVAMGAGSSVGEAVERLLELAVSNGTADDPVARQLLGRLIGDGMAVSLLDLQAVLAQLRDADPGPLAAVRKLAGVAHRQAVAEAALELTGTAGAAADGDASEFLNEFLLTRCLSIAGGTTQILLSLVAERQLGLPREVR
ncbi:MAG TPA: acyl-CoA dehydrogenase [Streptosporangiaceae bacterium]|nr:acyl-CoA dehydrogenase [Streptosporangiaceae bacterium]